MQLLVAAVIWSVPVVVLTVRGLPWIAAAYGTAGAAWAVPFLLLGALKARLLLRATRKVVDRIRARGPGRLLGCFSPGMWGVIALMMGGGVALRASPAPRGILGLVYVAVALALAISGARLWRAALVGEALPEP